MNNDTKKKKTESRQPSAVSDQTAKDNKQQLEESDQQTVGDNEVIELKTQLEEMTNQWKRAVADYQNLVKRTQEQQKEFVQFAVKNFLEKLLPVVDDLEMAQKHLKDQGLTLALKKLYAVFEQEGLTRIETEGKEYDIHTMEAIAIVDGKEDNKIVVEHRAGYLLHGSVLRPAQVTVSKKDDRK